MLHQEICLRISAFEKSGQILELAPILALQHARASRPFQHLDDDWEAEFAFDKAGIDRELAEYSARYRKAGAYQLLKAVELVGHEFDGGRAIYEPNAAALEMAQQR